jgi:flagellar motility protein MotE (MotC chaperone)
MIKIPAPRLLPVTITTIAVLLIVKCGTLLQAAVTDGQTPVSVMVAAANAADPERQHAKPAPAQAPPLSAPPADTPRGNTPKANTPDRSAANQEPPPVSDSEKAILQELRQRRKEIDTRETVVTARESVLNAAEQKLSVRVGELQALQQKLEGLDTAQKQKEDAGWQALVKLYEAMKPKEAAAILNELPMSVLLPVMDRMKPAKAALVMAAMTPEKARDLTAELAQLRTGQDTTSDSNAKPDPLGG